jgi:endonuclease YncB( thermonuclease family)
MTDKELWEKSQVWESSDDGRGKLKILESVEKFAELVRADERDRATRENAYVLAERNKVAAWMIAQGYATGHGDTMEGLLEELEREIGFKRAELWIKRINEAVLAEREACERAIEELLPNADRGDCATAIRARGQA